MQGLLLGTATANRNSVFGLHPWNSRRRCVPATQAP